MADSNTEQQLYYTVQYNANAWSSIPCHSSVLRVSVRCATCAPSMPVGRNRWTCAMAPGKSRLNTALLFPVGLCKRHCVKWPSWQTAGFVNRITAAIATVTLALLTGLWTELSYHLDICSTANGVHTGLD
jgi:hypothetical protein